MHKLDKIFLIGLLVIGVTGGMIDGFYWLPYEGTGGFPVYSLLSIFVSYGLWIILLMYSNTKYKNETKIYVRWYTYFIIPFIHIICIIPGWFIANIILKILNII